MFLTDIVNIPTERKYTDEGFLIVPARISRSGVQEYLAIELGVTDKEEGAKIRIFRSEEEVFSQNSLNSFANKPVTDNHPPELITSKNAKQFSVGHASPEIVKDGVFVKTILHVTDADAIAKIESGKVELSNGYTADIDWTPGVSPEGDQFDAVQRNIKGNHIAIVERGRAGPACRLADNLTTTIGDKVAMAKVTINGVDFEVSDQAAQAVVKLQKGLKDAEEEIQTEAEKAKAKDKKDKKDQMEEKEETDSEHEEEKEELKSKLADAKSKIPSTKTLDKLVADRQNVVSDVLKICPEIKWEGKDTMTLRKEVVGLKCENVQMDSVSDDYISARFDMLVESVSINSQLNLDNSFTQEVNNDNKVVDIRPASVIAREKMMADSRDAWKGGTN